MVLALILVRWMHLSASVLLAGIYFFQTLIIEPVARKRSASIEEVASVFHRLTWLTARWTLLVALLSWFTWGWLVAAIMSGDPLFACLWNGDWWSVVTSTQYGHLWLLRLGVAVILGIILYPPSGSRKPSAFAAITAGLAAFQLVSLAWAGHAAADPGVLGIAHLWGDALHLLTSGLWPGGLVPLAGLLFLFLKSRQLVAMEFVRAVVRRFSASSLIAVGVMACTGLMNSVFMVGNFGALLASAYGRILTFKIILFLAMVGFGAWNLWVLKPQLSIDAPAGSAAEQPKALHSLIRNVFWEIGLGLLVILIVGLLGIATPPVR